MPSFADYAADKWKWITPFDVGFYPDHFVEAVSFYKPSIDKFRELAVTATSSASLLRLIQREPQKIRIQLLRIYRRYVSPVTSVEMLKRVRDTNAICAAFEPLFRDIAIVRENIDKREYDIILSAILYEHKDRGKLGYQLTGEFFTWFDTSFRTGRFEALGPRGAGADIELKELFHDYPHGCPCDIVIRSGQDVLVVGFARYDSDRGAVKKTIAPAAIDRKSIRYWSTPNAMAFR